MGNPQRSFLIYYGKIEFIIIQILNMSETKSKTKRIVIPDRIGYIYLFTFPNGKQYIGQTSRNYYERWNEHRNAAQKMSSFIIYKSIRKYGWDNVIKDIICCCNVSQLNDLECKFIKQYKTLHPLGYNSTSGGGQNSILSDLHKKNISIAFQKRICNMTKNERDLYGKMMRLRHTGRKLTNESKNKIKLGLSIYHQNGGDSVYSLNKRSTSRRKYGKGLPRFVNIRHMASKTVFVIGKHPECSYKQFANKMDCLVFLLGLTNDIEDVKIIVICIYQEFYTIIKKDLFSLQEKLECLLNTLKMRHSVMTDLCAKLWLLQQNML